jgi:UDP-galactopyranose mutase
MNYLDFDLIIVGAGPVGCVLADRAARDMAWKCLVIEKRQHLAGNCYDFVHESGLLLHRYGPHYFRTQRESMVDYLSAYTEWIPGNYRVRALYKGELFPIPINLTTLERFFGRSLTLASARSLLENERIDITNPRNSEEYVLSKVGKRLYEAFYLGYTQKQWGLHPRELAPSVCGRHPVRFNRDDRYIDEPFQVMPKEGYTRLFGRMLRHPFIKVLLNTDFFEIREQLKPKRALIYTGPIDAYFNFCHGALPWRSLDFEWVEIDKEFQQPCVQINYPADHEYTRSVEIKHVTGQKHPHTVVSLEYPHSSGDPFYPVLTDANLAKYTLYKHLAEKETSEKGVFFCGRLATYSYINIDQAIEDALELYRVIKDRHSYGGPLGHRTRF